MAYGDDLVEIAISQDTLFNLIRGVEGNPGPGKETELDKTRLPAKFDVKLRFLQFGDGADVKCMFDDKGLDVFPLSREPFSDAVAPKRRAASGTLPDDVMSLFFGGALAIASKAAADQAGTGPSASSRRGSTRLPTNLAFAHLLR